jgi:hypothetical protein
MYHCKIFKHNHWHEPPDWVEPYTGGREEQNTELIYIWKRNWENCGLCPLCKQTEETNNHLFVHCRYTTRIWELLKDWLGIQGIHSRQWGGLGIQEWWSSMAEGPSMHRKELATLTLLTVWEIWQERNARVFRNKLSPTFVLLDKIKNEARLWVLAGAKGLGNLMPGE